MKKAYLSKIMVFLIGLILFTTSLKSQTSVFSSDFSTSQGASYTTSGQIGTSSFYVSRSGADWGARIDNDILENTNDASGSSNVLGWAFAYAETDDFSSPYNTTLSSNGGLVTWYFNMRQIRTDPSGFNSGSYGVAFILAGSNTTAYNNGTGYAVLLGQSGSTDPVRLAKYSAGVTSFTNLITSNTSGLTDFGADYLSVKVTYDPSNDQWELFLRNDGSSSFADPAQGSLTSQGTTTDNSYTETALDYMGGYWQGSTGGSQTAFFDNVSVLVTESSTPSITVNPSSLSGMTYVEGNGPSDETNFVISGLNLTANITITPPEYNFEISKTSGSGFVSYPNTLTLIHDGGTVGDSTIYVRLKAGLATDTYSGDLITASSSGASNKTVSLEGEVTAPPDPEPSEHVTAFTATKNSDSQITVTWTDAAGAQLPSAYLVKAAIDPANPSAPTDATEEANTTLIKNIAYGVQEAVFTGLEDNTTYNFSIWPYTNSGTDIDYKTDGTVPTGQATTDVAPTLIFSEDIGNVTATTAINDYTDWENGAPVAFTGDADVRSTSSSSGYTDASGLANVYISNSINKYFLIEGIDVIGYNDIYLSLGHYKSTTASSNELKIEVSSDGTNWTELTYSRATGTGTANWILINPTGTIPSNVENLRLRFTQTSATPQFRIDDIKLYGYPIIGGTYNTVDIEGSNSGWQAKEVFSNITTADYAHFTWDEDYLYFAISDDEADYNNMATYFFINSNLSNPSKTSSLAYAWGNYINVPFRANYVLIWKNDPGAHFIQLAKFEDGDWNVIANVPTDSVELTPFDMPGLVVNFKIGSDYREIKVPRKIFGLDGAGKQMKIASITEQQWPNYYRYYGWPEEGWTDAVRAANQTISQYYQYTLDEYIYPNDTTHLKEDISVTNNTTINSDVTYNHVFVEPNNSLTVANGYTLEIDGDFVIMSDENGTGSFIDNGNVIYNGNVTVQKYLPDVTQTGWYLSSPVSNADFSVFDNSDGLWEYTPGGWAAVNIGTLTPLRGYVSKYETAGNSTIYFTQSTLNTGTVSYDSFTRTGVGTGNYGWNLAGNPYPSPIDWELVIDLYGENQDFVDATHLNASIHIREWDGGVHTYVPYDSPDDPERIIPAMQAFWVQVNENYADGEINIDNTVRVHANNNLYKTLPEISILKLNINRDGNKDNTTLFFKDGATELFDAAYDAVKMYSYNEQHPQIYTLNSLDEELAINTNPALSSNKTIKLGFTTHVSGSFDIETTKISGFDTDVCIYLEDTYENIITDLKQQPLYTFSSDVDATTERFKIHFITQTASTDEMNLDNNVLIFSNENDIYLTHLSSQNAVVSVFNMLGQEVLTQQIKPASLNKISTSLSTGHYIVKVIDGTQIISQKVFIR